MSKKDTMLQGNLYKAVLLFAIPLALTSILQQLFNAADVAIVGRFAGSDSLAAVGANGSIINLFVNSFVGLSVGANVIIAQYIGQERFHHVRRAVHTSLIVAVVLGLVLTVVGIFLAPMMLEMISTPQSILPLAVLYLRIYSIGIPFIMLYNFEAAILRSQGNTRRPLISLTAAGIINVILNLFFVIGLHMSVDGVAIATVISNVVSSLDLLVYLIRSDDITSVRRDELRFDAKITKQMTRVGLPASLQGAVFSVSNVVIQSQVNSFGAQAIAGSAAAVNLEILAYYVVAAFGQTGLTFIGQNFGAKNYRRCFEVVKTTMIECMIAIFLVALVMIPFARPLNRIFSNDPAVLDVAVIRVRTLITFEFLNAGIEVLSGCLRGFGHSQEPAIITIVGVCGVRILWIFTAVRKIHTFQMLMWAYPISWLFTVIGLILVYLHVIKPYKDALKA